MSAAAAYPINTPMDPSVKQGSTDAKSVEASKLLESVIEVLNKENKALTVKDIKVKLDDMKITVDTSEINSVLYKNSKLFTKTMVDGSKAPHWKAKFTPADLKAKDENKGKVVKYLEEKGATLTTKLVTDLKIEKSELNALLYEMEKLKIASKTAEPNGTKPTWSLVKSTSK
ncbi:MAG: hypothetical protein Solumvirus1_44 [Solumvirus sp.]|uniref:Z-binding domain-containing protein n=1 Tax=Solumvirus sp. TaxID=2487773 RepID=A0A3G5AK69_9VIRU|nr:MAG: hypothetical protein Solumvirus1_44 [Solumvirus sp.]